MVNATNDYANKIKIKIEKARTKIINIKVLKKWERKM